MDQIKINRDLGASEIDALIAFRGEYHKITMKDWPSCGCVVSEYGDS